MLPAESGITYDLGLLGGRRTVDGGPEKASCEAASLPRMIFRASLPPGSFGASLPGMLFPASLPDAVGLPYCQRLMAVRIEWHEFASQMWHKFQSYEITLCDHVINYAIEQFSSHSLFVCKRFQFLYR